MKNGLTTLANRQDTEHAPLDLSRLPLALHTKVDQAKSQQQHRRSENTVKSYLSAWASFVDFCDSYGFNPLPASPEILMAYLGQEMTRTFIAQFNGQETARHLSNSAIAMRVAAIRHFHIEHGHDSPTYHPEIIKSLEGFRRNQTREVLHDDKSPLLNDELGQLVTVISDNEKTLIKSRDLALILLLRAGAFRRSEIVKLKVEDLAFRLDGLEITIRFSKSNQDGKKQVKWLPDDEAFSANDAIKQWLEISGIESGYIFRSITRNSLALRTGPDEETPTLDPPVLCGADVNRILKGYLVKACIDVHRFAAHSARSGFVTQMGSDGEDAMKIQRRTLHKDLRMLSIYNK
ncbi:hypothetical protein TUM4438_44700 [Shewanella sairae]|uniref:Tyrosine-type recombinase/integrase n=1 Tax=Shewanella sairae TaxID=190310 RepID=A0ABQ4PRK8_9GAMM|nr:tyrosine-type recombinase/integrase [Shewanella sairae]MCL1132421.1 tyrosine-type recombinase/integrase [Shewanella sairae]GIU52313.1 hypothetical protein TUM4438_44700 [Shewanella sairae]